MQAARHFARVQKEEAMWVIGGVLALVVWIVIQHVGAGVLWLWLRGEL